MADYTVADMAAINGGKNCDNFLEGNGIIILILFFLMFGGYGNGFGANNSSLQGSLTRAEMSDGFNMAEVQSNQTSMMRDILENRYNNAIGQAGLDKSIMENKYDAAMQAQAMQAQMAQCCCDIKTTVIEQNQQTRDMIQANYISGLQTALSDEKAKNSNYQQTQFILGQQGKWYCNPPYNGCGC